MRHEQNSEAPSTHQLFRQLFFDWACRSSAPTRGLEGFCSALVDELAPGADAATFSLDAFEGDARAPGWRYTHLHLYGDDAPAATLYLPDAWRIDARAGRALIRDDTAPRLSLMALTRRHVAAGVDTLLSGAYVVGFCYRVQLGLTMTRWVVVKARGDDGIGWVYALYHYDERVVVLKGDYVDVASLRDVVTSLVSSDPWLLARDALRDAEALSPTRTPGTSAAPS